MRAQIEIITKELNSFSVILVSLLANDLHDNCSLSWVYVSFHKYKRLPGAKNSFSLYNG